MRPIDVKICLKFESPLSDFVIKHLYAYILLFRFHGPVCLRTVNMSLFRCCGTTWNCIRIQGSLCTSCGMLRVSFVSCGFSWVFRGQFSFWATEEHVLKKMSLWIVHASSYVTDFVIILLFVLQVKTALFCLRVSVKFGVAILSLCDLFWGDWGCYMLSNKLLVQV